MVINQAVVDFVRSAKSQVDRQLGENRKLLWADNPPTYGVEIGTRSFRVPRGQFVSTESVMQQIQWVLETILEAADDEQKEVCSPGRR